MLDLSLLGLATLCAGLHLYGRYHNNFHIKAVFKPVPVLILCVLSLLWDQAIVERTGVQQVGDFTTQIGGKHYGWWITVGLVCSVFGDFFLLWPKCSLYGIISFLLAHVCFVSAFTTDEINLTLSRVLPFASTWLVFLFGFYHLFIKPSNPNRPPFSRFMVSVFVFYSLILWGMALVACLRVHPEWAQASPSHVYGLAGAVLFVLSDILIVVNAIVHYSVFQQFVSMGIYWIAQFLLTLSVCRYVSYAAPHICILPPDIPPPRHARKLPCIQSVF
jgi:uncharacterized membrane protein YhhN